MENWFELLIPVIIVLLYLFQRIWSGGEEIDERPPGESDTSDEARRIQEEIRRKIVTRQQGRQAREYVQETVRDDYEPVPAEATTEPERFERFESAPENRRDDPGGFHTSSGESERSAEEHVPGLAPVGESRQRDYQAELQEQLRRVEEAKQMRRQATHSAGEVVRKAGTQSNQRLGGKQFEHQAGRVQRRYGTYAVDALVDDLRSPDGLRKAFLMREILDRPVGMRSLGDTYADFSRDR